MTELQPSIFFYTTNHEFGWMSNFYMAEQTVRGKKYPTNEHYYQSAKARDPEVAAWIAQAPNPYLAMRSGRALRPNEIVRNWENVKLQVMKIGLLAKFSQNPDLKKMLLSTGNVPIHEDSSHEVYGVKNGGLDMLGRLLMEVRKELRES